MTELELEATPTGLIVVEDKNVFDTPKHGPAWPSGPLFVIF